MLLVVCLTGAFFIAALSAGLVVGRILSSWFVLVGFVAILTAYQVNFKIDESRPNDDGHATAAAIQVMIVLGVLLGWAIGFVAGRMRAAAVESRKRREALIADCFGSVD
jgi:uncharacterized membrane protein